MLYRRHLRIKVLQGLYAWYTSESDDLKKGECNYNCNIVLNKYFGIKPKEEKKSTTVNEVIYNEIRNLMDTGARRFRMEQEKAQYIQKMKEQMEEKRKQYILSQEKEKQPKLETMNEESINEE